MLIFVKMRQYKWECSECKVCSVCKSVGELVFCDVCDRGYHGTCLDSFEGLFHKWLILFRLIMLLDVNV
jgi:hypothetical protein